RPTQAVPHVYEQASCRKLRPPAAYLLSNSFVLFLDAVALVLLRAHLPLLHLILTTAIPLGVALLGLEYVLNFVLDFFRPRVPGKELRPAYDSRLLGLFAEPGSLWGAVADTLDYQFGFRVSRTWFVHFLARLALPLIAFQLLSGLLLTCLVIVGPEEAVLVERLGRPRVQFSPGLHFKLPWPIEQARSLPAESLQSLIIGFHAGDEDSDEEDEHGHSHGGQRPALPRGMVVWTQPHHVQEDYILVASRGMPGTTAAEPASGNAAPGGAEHSVPVNLLSLSLVLHFQIIDAAEYLYGYQSPRHFLENLAYRELVKLASSTDMHEIMGPRRLNLAQEIRERLEAQIANARIGVRIHDLGFLEVHPPVHVGQAFEAIVEAQVHSESLIVQARSEAEKTVREAESQAHSLLQEALAYQFQRVEIGRSTGLSFDHHLAAYQAGRQLYLSRYRLLAMEEALRGKRKLVLPSKMGQQRLILKLEDRLQADLLQIDLQK
ncbi:MAG: hypothetical protein HYU43_01345, partial [Armatimonadetes bacterium]|nr:hypothetical protein [Armatimonadota bacterium]